YVPVSLECARDDIDREASRPCLREPLGNLGPGTLEASQVHVEILDIQGRCDTDERSQQVNLDQPCTCRLESELHGRHADCQTMPKRRRPGVIVGSQKLMAAHDAVD